MRKTDIDRICAATLQGRFGPSVITLKQSKHFKRASAGSSDVAATIRTAAIWTSARSGAEQGKL